jgi:hypothetical protein
MSTQDAFELWIKSDWPEVDLTRLPSGNYRIKSTQDKYEGFLAGHEEGRMLGRLEGADDYRDAWER